MLRRFYQRCANQFGAVACFVDRYRRAREVADTGSGTRDRFSRRTQGRGGGRHCAAGTDA